MNSSPICSSKVATRAHVLAPLHIADAAGAGAAGAMPPAGNAAHPLWQEGYQKGTEDARRLAEAEILRAAEALAKAAEQLQSVERSFIGHIQRDLLRLSLAIARRVVMAEIQTNPDALGEMIARLLDEAEDRKVVAVRLHPDDAKHFSSSPAAQTLREAGITVQSSPEVGPGGVVLETGFGKLDARLETRFAEIATALFGDAPSDSSSPAATAELRTAGAEPPTVTAAAEAPSSARESRDEAPRSQPLSGTAAESLWENQPAYSHAHAASVERRDESRMPVSESGKPKSEIVVQEAHT